jgi:hypothetical protein
MPSAGGSRNGRRRDAVGGWQRLAATPEGRSDLIRGLTEMRVKLASETDARILLGGRSGRFLGLYPGILEEALLAIACDQPLYVLGAFGGAVRLVARALRGERPAEFDIQYQTSKSADYAHALRVYEAKRARQPELKLAPANYETAIATLVGYGAGDAENPSQLARANGLDDAENRILLGTASLDEALHLIMKGLGQVFGSATAK